MSKKRKAKQTPADISITGGVKGIGNVVGNKAQSKVMVSNQGKNSRLSRRASNVSPLWIRISAFLITLVSVFFAVSLFLRLLDNDDVLLGAQLVFACLLVAMGISGFLKPNLFADLFAKLLGKK